MENLPKSKEEALICNARFYFTGVPCCSGHICRRRTTTKKCELCAKEISKKSSIKNKDSIYKQHLSRKHSMPREYLLRGAITRSRKHNCPCSISIDDIVVPEYCPILGIKLEINYGKYKDNSPSLDRIVPVLGYVPGNIMVISMRANMIKNNASVEELRKVYNYLLNLKQ